MQPSTPPTYGGWFPVGNILATGASYISSTLWNSSGPENSTIIPGLEKKVDLVSFIICIALRGFLGPGYKPSLTHYHITWDPPAEKDFKAIKIPTQGCDRWQRGENASRDIIDDWEEFTEKALGWFKPLISANQPEDVPAQPNVEGDNSRRLLAESEKKRAERKRLFQISEIFKLAIKGFEATKEPYLQEQHLPKTKQIILKLENCKKKIENAFDRAALNLVEAQAENNSLVEMLKNSWDERAIDNVYTHFLKLQELPEKMRSPLQQQSFTDHTNCIEAEVKCKCTDFAMIHDDTRMTY